MAEMHGVSLTSEDGEAPNGDGGRKQGGWITFPFIMATMAGLSLAAGGWVSNLIVYLIEEFNIKSISAAKIYNFVNGCITLFPIVGAIIADSFLGCFAVIWISSLMSLLGIVLLVLTAKINALTPPECENGSSLCKDPSGLQRAVLYAALALASIGIACTRFTIAPMGANQFSQPRHQATFFNWYIFTLYASTIISSTAIVYVEDNVSWALGFGLCGIANILGLAIFLAGTCFYRRLEPEGTPFMGLVRVIVAAIQKRKGLLSNKDEYYHDPNDAAKTPTEFFKFLNRAAMITNGDTKSDGSIAKRWRLCTVQQVEDLKSLIKLFPLWCSGLLLAIPLVIQASMAVIQALTMDRHLGPNFKIPAGSIVIFIFLGTCTTIPLVDRLLFPMLEKFTCVSLTPLRRIGIGHVLTVISMAVSAITESKRLNMANSHHLKQQINGIVPMSVLWLLPQLALAGVGETFHFPGHVAFYYQEFPASLKSTSTAVFTLFIGISYYLANPVIDLINELTGWLPDNINVGRLDNVYWICCGIGALNFTYYLVCSKFYKYRNDVTGEDEPAE